MNREIYESALVSEINEAWSAAARAAAAAARGSKTQTLSNKVKNARTAYVEHSMRNPPSSQVIRKLHINLSKARFRRNKADKAWRNVKNPNDASNDATYSKRLQTAARFGAKSRQFFRISRAYSNALWVANRNRLTTPQGQP